jgi:serine/threonine-protein kinase
MGSRTFGKHTLIAELGHGGMADVFLAVQAGPSGLGFRKLTVVKRLRENLVDEPEFVAMLVDEARIAARLNHPNVVQTNEVGNVGNQYYITMEYLDGQPLHRIQHRSMQRAKNGDRAPLTTDQQCLILMDALAGLHHAHELKDFDGTPLEIVHRDMTPQNIFVTYQGQIKVVDFGIAKAAGRASETRQGVVKGKVRYMAPEQAIGGAVTRRSDVFAVGIMLWEAAIGRRMWKDKDDLEIVQMLVSGQLPPMPREVDPSTPEELDRICRKALAFKADDRYPTAEALRVDIEHYLNESGKLVSARRELAATVGELFADKQAEIKAIIEKQLASIDDAAPSNDLAVVPQDALSMSSLPITPTQPSEPSLAGAAKSTTPASIAPPTRPNRLRAIVASAAVALALLTAFKVWKSNSTSSAPAVPDQVSVHFNATPATARIVLDNDSPASVPLSIRVPRDEKQHDVRVFADGFATRTSTVNFTRDIDMTFELAPLPATSAAPAANTDPKATVSPAVAAAPAAINRRGTWPPPAKSVELKPDPVAAAPAPAPAPAPAKPAPSDGRKLSLDKGDPWADKK